MICVSVQNVKHVYGQSLEKILSLARDAVSKLKNLKMKERKKKSRLSKKLVLTVPSRSWMETRTLVHYLLLVLNVLNARMVLRFGGYSKQDLQMKQLRNSTDVLSATTHGAAMRK